MNHLRKAVAASSIILAALAGGATSMISPTVAQADVGTSEICAALGVGASGAGLASKVLARGAGWAGVAISVGCYAYDEISQITDEEARAAVEREYVRFQNMSQDEKLAEMGLDCRGEVCRAMRD
ncbi:hypothetical protein [Nocardia sp. NBC_00403]|uniref:hypothetical protein n=1 Tax=Nocardia sp. NBC_00403 TaxID=2975990 RepID=UPI002E1B557D